MLAETIESDVKIKTTRGTRKIKTRKLGPVGGRIVAETFVGTDAWGQQFVPVAGSALETHDGDQWRVRLA